MAVRFQPKAARDAKGLPRQDRDRLIERLERIARDPRGNHPDVERLKGVEGVYRVPGGLARSTRSPQVATLR
jgi:mRNA-degrading endonuclease RelE of RelBE toxin-antitoxin system